MFLLFFFLGAEIQSELLRVFIWLEFTGEEGKNCDIQILYTVNLYILLNYCQIL